MTAPIPITRRSMVKATGCGLLSAAFASQIARAAEPFKTAGFRIGACDWTLGKRANPEALALAKALGLDGVQVDLGGGAEEDLPLRRPEVQQQYLEAVREHGVAIGSLALGSMNQIPYKSSPRAEQWVLEAIDLCSVFNTKVVLLAFFSEGDLRGDPKGVDVVVDRLKAAAPRAEAAGVVLGIESWLSAEEHLAILDRVGSKAVQVYYDVGNSQKEGHDIHAEIRQLGLEKICEFHAKDYDDLYGKGSMDFHKVRESMDAIGYRGWIHIEGTQFPLGREESIRYDAEYLRPIFPA